METVLPLAPNVAPVLRVLLLCVPSLRVCGVVWQFGFSDDGFSFVATRRCLRRWRTAIKGCRCCC